MVGLDVDEKSHYLDTAFAPLGCWSGLQRGALSSDTFKQHVDLAHKF